MFNNLPESLNSEIETFFCEKKINGTKSSNEIIIKFETNQKASTVHQELLNWLFKCLDTISNKVYDQELEQYHWNIVSQILDDNYNDIKLNEIKNSIIVAIHITDSSDEMSFNNDSHLTLSYNYNPVYKLTPKEIIDCLREEPGFIKKIGVSAVSSGVMMKWWKDMISVNSNHFDICGRGPMQHPMWKKSNDLWSSIREMSFNFQWRNYD